MGAWASKGKKAFHRKQMVAMHTDKSSDVKSYLWL